MGGAEMKEGEKNTPIMSSLVSQSLIEDLRQIVEQARCRVASKANAELTVMYWHIGERINREVLDNQRAEYGKQIIALVAQQLKAEFGGKGFEKSSITRMMKFAKLFPDEIFFYYFFKIKLFQFIFFINSSLNCFFLKLIYFCLFFSPDITSLFKNLIPFIKATSFENLCRTCKTNK